MSSRDRSASDVRVTVAICTYNRASLLERTFASLTELEIPATLSWELLVVDNNSTDSTQAVCEAFRGRLPMRVVIERNAGLSHARNCALRTAAGEYLVYTDDDVLLDRGWLRAFADATRRWPDAAAFGGPIEPDFPVTPAPELTAAFPILARGFCGIDHRRAEGPLPGELPIWGANMGYRRASVGSLQFDPRFGYTPSALRGGEETRFLDELRARGGAVIWCPDMRLKHYVDPSRMTVKYLVSRYTASGEEYIRQHGVPTDPAFLGAPRWLLRKTVEAYLRYAVSRLGRNRITLLTRLREYSELRGMVRECRASAGADR